MKKNIIIILLGISLFVGCENIYRDELAQIHKELNGINARLNAFCDETNTNIAALQTMIAALQAMDYVTGIVPIIENGKEVGYQITFDKSGKVTIYHGNDGVNGADGKDGYTPQIGVMLHTDGLYYWTLDGEWLTDESGNMIKAVGVDGEDGANGANGKDGVTPKLKVENGHWYISYDNGLTWEDEPLGKATGDQGPQGDSLFNDIDCSNKDFILITLSNGQTIKLPIWNAKDDIDDIISTPQSVTYIPKYSDGRIRVKDDIIELDFQILPISSISEVAENWQSILSLKVIYTITRAVSFIDMPILSCTPDETNGVITIVASCANLDINYYYGVQSVNTALNLSYDNCELSSEYIPFAPYDQPDEIWYTSTDANIVSPYNSEAFDVAIISNTYENGKGVIKFDGNLTEIKADAFYAKNNLSSVMIPSKVTTIGDDAFGACTKLMNIYCKPLTPPSIYLYFAFYYESLSSTRRSVFAFNSGMKIYVPNESYDAYTKYTSISTSNSEKTVQANWGAYVSYIEPL